MKTLLLISIFSISVFAQHFEIEGTVYSDGNPLPYANVRVAEGTTGAAANKNGTYKLHIAPGNYKLVASYIGFISDTVDVEVVNSDIEIDFHLMESPVDLPEVTVLPGDNPAHHIIRKAIERKHTRDAALESYTFQAFTKALIKTTEDIGVGGNEVSIGLDTDTSALKISGILENHSTGYVKKPGLQKDIILAQKQTANLPSNINLLTGGRLVQNFYTNDLEFFGTNMVSPLSDNAIDYYFFFIRDSLSIDGKRVYKIYMTPDNVSDPGFQGHIYILANTYDLLKVELTLNDAANFGGIFDSIGIFQQFFSFTEKDIYMPVDYHLGVEANFLGLARFGFELNSSLYDYNINVPITEDFFDKAIITVKPEADKMDSTYWETVPTIPETVEEEQAYERLDSLANAPVSFWDRYSFLSSEIEFSDNLSISNLPALYHFNRVEGNAIDFGINYNDSPTDRFNTNLDFSYGFADEKLKSDLYARYYFGDYRTERLHFSAFQKTAVQFGSTDSYGEFFNSLAALISKYEFRDYYYTKGFRIDFSSEIFPVIEAEIGFENRTDNNAFTNSDFSFFNTDKSYRPNRPIYETRLNILSFGLTFNFQDYIEDGKYRRRFYGNQSYFGFSTEVELARKDLLSSGLDFTTYGLNFYGNLKTTRTTELRYLFRGRYTDGARPFQLLFAAPGNINLAAERNTFRTLGYNEVIGDRMFTLFLEHRFGNSLFRWLSIPLLKDYDFTLTAFLNSGLFTISDESKNILVNQAATFDHPFYEAGFSFGHMLSPVSIHFGWRLNYTEENSFRIGIQSAILL